MLILNKPNHARKQLEKLTFIPQAAEKVEFLADSRAFKTRILQLIHSAKSRIYLTALYFEKDEAGQEILAALYQAKQANANWYTQQKAEHNLEKAIEFWGVPINKREVFGVLHLKGFIFDNTLVYSGASINNVYLQQFERYRYDRYQHG